MGDGLEKSRGCTQKESWKRICIKSQKIPQAGAHVITNLRKQEDPREHCSEHTRKNCNKMWSLETETHLKYLIVHSMSSDTENLLCPKLMVVNLNQMEMAFSHSCSVFNIP